MDKGFVAQLDSYRITTAEILYWMPDHKHLLQSYIWQNLDLAPRFPNLTKFLDFWERNLEGKLHKVTVARSEEHTLNSSHIPLSRMPSSA